MEEFSIYKMSTENLEKENLPTKSVSFPQFRVATVIFFIFAFFLTSPSKGNDWVEVEVGIDSGDTYLWPYFYTASRFIDVNSIAKDSDYIMYKELVDSVESKSKNVVSLIVEKKSRCDGKAVLWKSFVIYDSNMGRGKAIMKLSPNESEPLERGRAGRTAPRRCCRRCRRRRQTLW